MREIKFRCWDKFHKNMTEDLHLSNGISLNEALEENEDWLLLQYTGFTDRNEVKIYEGDIVRWGMNGGECWVRYAKVELSPSLQFRIIYYVEEKTDAKRPSDNYVFEFGDFAYKQTNVFLEVIGNIYENRELLE